MKKAILMKVGGLGRSLFALGIICSVYYEIDVLLIITIFAGLALMGFGFCISVKDKLRDFSDDETDRYTKAVLYAVSDTSFDLLVTTSTSGLTLLMKWYLGKPITLAGIKLVSCMMPVAIVFGLISLFTYATYKAYESKDSDN